MSGRGSRVGQDAVNSWGSSQLCCDGIDYWKALIQL